MFWLLLFGTNRRATKRFIQDHIFDFNFEAKYLHFTLKILLKWTLSPIDTSLYISTFCYHASVHISALFVKYLYSL